MRLRQKITSSPDTKGPLVPAPPINHFPSKEPGLLGEMANTRFGAGNV